MICTNCRNCKIYNISTYLLKLSFTIIPSVFGIVLMPSGNCRKQIKSLYLFFFITKINVSQLAWLLLDYNSINKLKKQLQYKHIHTHNINNTSTMSPSYVYEILPKYHFYQNISK